MKSLDFATSGIGRCRADDSLRETRTEVADDDAGSCGGRDGGKALTPLTVDSVAENRFAGANDGRGLTLETMTLLDVAVEDGAIIVD